MQRVPPRAWAFLLFLLADHFLGPSPCAHAEITLIPPSATPLVEFSGSLVKQVDGRRAVPVQYCEAGQNQT